MKNRELDAGPAGVTLPRYMNPWIHAQTVSAQLPPARVNSEGFCSPVVLAFSMAGAYGGLPNPMRFPWPNAVMDALWEA